MSFLTKLFGQNTSGAKGPIDFPEFIALHKPECLTFDIPINYGPWNPGEGGYESLVLEKSIGIVQPPPDGKCLLCTQYAKGNEIIKIIDWEAGRCNQKLIGLPSIYCIAYAPYSSTIAIGGFRDVEQYRDRRVQLFSYPLFNFIGFLPDYGSSPTCICFPGDASRCAIGYNDGEMRLWDIKSRRLLCTCRRVVTSVCCCASLGENVVFGGMDGRLILWETAKNSTVGLKMDGEWSIDIVAVSGDKLKIAFGDHYNAVEILDARDYHRLRGFELPDRAHNMFFLGDILFTKAIGCGLWRSVPEGNSYSDSVELLPKEIVSIYPTPDGQWLVGQYCPKKSDTTYIIRTRLK